MKVRGEGWDEGLERRDLAEVRKVWRDARGRGILRQMWIVGRYLQRGWIVNSGEVFFGGGDAFCHLTSLKYFLCLERIFRKDKVMHLCMSIG
jgi:hypothetical protein